MSERIHRVMDGELPPDRLRATDFDELEAYDEAVAGALAPIRAEPVPDVAPDVMSRIAAMPRYGRERRFPLARLWHGFWQPRTVVLRPAWALAAAALGAVLVAGPFTPDRPDTPAGSSPAVAVAGQARVFVQFRLDAPDASSVALAADFTGWQPRYSLNRAEQGIWTLVVPVEPGVHQYAFVIDGDRWAADPMAPAVDDGFGGSNSRLEVLPPDWRPL